MRASACSLPWILSVCEDGTLSENPAKSARTIALGQWLGGLEFRSWISTANPKVAFCHRPFWMHCPALAVRPLSTHVESRFAVKARMEFTYHRKLSPIVGVILTLACIETIVLHIVAMAFWGWKIAIVIGLLDLSLILMLYRMIRSFRLNPIIIRGNIITMRTGGRMSVPVAVDEIAGFRATWSGEDLKGRHVLNMALAAWPTIMFDLKNPIARRGKSITTIAHCVDDPETFRRVVRQLSEVRVQDPSST